MLPIEAAWLPKYTRRRDRDGGRGSNPHRCGRFIGSFGAVGVHGVLGRDHQDHGRANHPWLTGTSGWAYFAVGNTASERRWARTSSRRWWSSHRRLTWKFAAFRSSGEHRYGSACLGGSSVRVQWRNDGRGVPDLPHYIAAGSIPDQSDRSVPNACSVLSGCRGTVLRSTRCTE